MPENRPFVGVGLKFQHFSEILKKKPCIDFFEVHAENCFGEIALKNLQKIKKDYTLTIHGLGLSLGSAQPPCLEHLAFLKSIITELDPLFFSEHISWSHINGIYMNDLLPFPYTDKTLKFLCDNINKAQEFLNRQLILENISVYLSFKESIFSETEFLTEVCKRTGCGLLLDINNVFVSSKNVNFNPYEYIDNFPAFSVKEVHLAGHTFINVKGQEICIDDHGGPISSEVWDLYIYSLKKIGVLPTLVEWDNNIPPFSTLIEEALKVKALIKDF